MIRWFQPVIASAADAPQDFVALYRYFRGPCRFGRWRAVCRAVYCLV